jgi:Tfp pilus assembly protein PilF
MTRYIQLFQRVDRVESRDSKVIRILRRAAAFIPLAAALAISIFMPANVSAQGASRAEKGMELLRAAKLEEALTEFREAAKANPKDIKAHVGMALAYRAQNKLPEAVTAYRAAVEASPRQPELRLDLGTTLLQQGKTADARQEFERAAELAPYRAKPYQSLGAAYVQERRYTDALQAYIRALGYEPDDHATHTAIAQLYAEQETTVRHASASSASLTRRSVTPKR